MLQDAAIIKITPIVISAGPSSSFWFIQGVAFIYGIFLYGFSTFQPPHETNTWSNRR